MSIPNIKPGPKIVRLRKVMVRVFNNISVISWRLVLLVEETGGPGESQRLDASH